MRTFRLLVIYISAALFIVSPVIAFWGDMIHISNSIRARFYLVFIVSGFVFLGTILSGLTPDEITTINNKLRLGYTRQDLLDEGYTEAELRNYEIKTWRDIPTTSPEEEEEKKS